MKTVNILLYNATGVLVKNDTMPVNAFHGFAVRMYEQLGKYDAEECADTLINEIEEELAPCVDNPANNYRFEFLKV